MALFKEETQLVTGNSVFQNPATRYIAYAMVALLLSVAQRLLLGGISIDGVAPDLLLIFAVMVALGEGQFVGLLAAFGAGLIFDTVNVGAFGSSALAKVISVYVAGLFFREGMFKITTGSMKFLGIVALCSFVNNIIYHFFSLRLTQVDFIDFFVKYGVSETLYTTVFAAFPMLYFARKKM